MKRLMTWLALFGALSVVVAPVFAQDKAPEKAASEAPAPKTDATKDAAPAVAAPAASAEAAPAATPKCGDKGFDCNKGDVAWMMTSTAFVLLMTVPGLALFYAGMVRRKNALSTVMQSFAI